MRWSKGVSWKKGSGYEVESLDGTVCIPLPSLIECNDIPNSRDEIPTPDVARGHIHLKSVAHLIPEQDPQAPIMLLLGRDIIRVHKVRKQVNGPHNLPYAQKLDLGWVIVGNVCLGNVHKPLTIRTFHTIVRPGSIDPMTAVVQRVKAFCVLLSFLFHDTTRLNGTLFLIYFISLFHLTP